MNTEQTSENIFMYFTPCSSVSIVNLIHAITDWDIIFWRQILDVDLEPCQTSVMEVFTEIVNSF